MAAPRPTMKIDRVEVISILISNDDNRNIKELKGLKSRVLVEMLATDYTLMASELNEQLTKAKDVI